MSKRPAGALIAPLHPGAGQRVPQRVRVYRTVLEAIRKGQLQAGTRLPSARLLAADWGVARSAVDEAFEQLQIEGFVERRVGDGTYVRAGLPAPPPAEAKAVVRPPSRQALAVLDRMAVYIGKPGPVELPVRLLTSEPLFPRAPMLDDFPLATWRRLIQRAHADEYRSLLNYGPAAGLPQACEAVARHLSLTRGTDCLPKQVLILNGPMQAIELIARVLLEPGDEVWVEDPGHASLPPLLRALHARPVGVPLDRDGLDVAAGRRLAPKAAAVYLHPLTQFPLGVRTTTERRTELLQWADESGAWVIEGNFNDELAHDGNAPQAFQRLDRSDRVLLMGTFEGILYPSLRLAYLVVPQRLKAVFVAMRGLLGDHTSTAMQLALAWFIDEGHMSAHLRRLRHVARDRGQAFVAAALLHLPAWARLGPVDSGTHACVHLPADVSDVEVVKRMRQLGVAAFALSTISATAEHMNGLVLGYAAFDEGAIELAMRRIGGVLRAMPGLPDDLTSPAA